MTAPIASGRSDGRVGLAPTEERRLTTAHTQPEHPVGYTSHPGGYKNMESRYHQNIEKPTAKESVSLPTDSWVRVPI